LKYSIMEERDIERVIDIYLDYYNEKEDCTWTHDSAYKRIHQVWSTEDSFSLVLTEDNTIVGFAMGYFVQYDDIIAYDLIEIVIATMYQHKGLGTLMMLELERRIKERGASLIQITAVNDDLHEQFYNKLDYQTAKNLILKSKWIE